MDEKRFENVNDTQIELQQIDVNDDRNIQNDLSSEQGIDLNAIENQDPNHLSTNQKKGMSKAYYYSPPPPPVPAEIRYIDNPAPNNNEMPIPNDYSAEGRFLEEERRRRLHEQMEGINTANSEQNTSQSMGSDNQSLSEEEQLINNLQEQNPDYRIYMPQNETSDTSDDDELNKLQEK